MGKDKWNEKYTYRAVLLFGGVLMLLNLWTWGCLLWFEGAHLESHVTQLCRCLSS